jgi:chromosome segregation ATPase
MAARLLFAVELENARRAQEEEIERITAGKSGRGRQDLEHAVEEAIATVRAELGADYEARAVEQREEWRSEWSSTRRDHEEARAALVGRVNALTADLAAVRQRFDAELQERMAEQGEAGDRIAALEDLAAGQARELTDARAEIPDLETEIGVLRTELTSARAAVVVATSSTVPR